MEWLLNLDGQILLWIQEFVRQDWMNGFWKFITTLGDKGLFWLALSFVLIMFKKTRKAGILALCSIALGFIFTNACLKNLVARPRPYTQLEGLIPLIPKPGDWSFPSGHTCVSFAAALAYYKWLPKTWGILAVILASLVALSRLYLGVHYPTDIIGGFVVAFLCVTILNFFINGKKGRR